MLALFPVGKVNFDHFSEGSKGTGAPSGVKKKTLRAVINRAERLGAWGGTCLGEDGKFKEQRRIRRRTEQQNAF